MIFTQLIIAKQTQTGEVYVGGHLLETDGANITFNLTTTFPAKDRRVTLLQNPVYRSTVTHNSMGYYQSPMTSVTQQVDIMDGH